MYCWHLTVWAFAVQNEISTLKFVNAQSSRKRQSKYRHKPKNTHMGILTTTPLITFLTLWCRRNFDLDELLELFRNFRGIAGTCIDFVGSFSQLLFSRVPSAARIVWHVPVDGWQSWKPDWSRVIGSTIVAGLGRVGSGHYGSKHSTPFGLWCLELRVS